MFKKIIILISLFINFLFSSQFIDNSVSDNCLCSGSWSVSNDNFGSGQHYYFYDSDNKLSQDSCSVNSSKKNNYVTSSTFHNGGEYSDYEIVEFSSKLYSCEICEEDNTDWKPALDENITYSQIGNIEYESGNLPSECSDDGYVIQDRNIDCSVQFRCMKSELPFFPCKEKEPLNKWEQLPNVSDSSDCFDYVDGTSIVSSDYISSTFYKPTCCILFADEDKDTDGDGVKDKDERGQGTDPNNKDTDGDGKLDTEGSRDTDGDGINDALESSTKDADGDGVDDEHDFTFTPSNTGLNGSVTNNSDGTISNSNSTIIGNTTTTITTTYNTNGDTADLDNPIKTVVTQTTNNGDGTSTQTTTTTNNIDGSTFTETTNTNSDGSTTTTATTNNSDGSTITTESNNTSSDNSLDSLEDKADKTNENLEKLSGDIKDFSNINHNDLSNLNRTLGDNGDKIEDLGGGLGDIRDVLNGTNEEGVDKSKELKFDGAMSSVNDFRNMVSNGFDSVRGTFKDAPQLSPSQSQCDFSFSLSSGTNINVDVHSYIIKLRPYLDIIWTFLFALIGFKIYLFVFIKITEFLR